MQGQANHFVRYAPEKIEYGMKRYTNETKRLYGVIEKHLASGKEWLAADQYTIADMANFAWIAWHDWAGEYTSGSTGKLEAFHPCLLVHLLVHSLGCLSRTKLNQGRYAVHVYTESDAVNPVTCAYLQV